MVLVVSMWDYWQSMCSGVSDWFTFRVNMARSLTCLGHCKRILPASCWQCCGDTFILLVSELLRQALLMILCRSHWQWRKVFLCLYDNGRTCSICQHWQIQVLRYVLIIHSYH